MVRAKTKKTDLVFAGTRGWNKEGMATSSIASHQMGATRDVAHDQLDSNLWGGVREKPSRSRQHVGKAAGLAAVRFVNTAAIRVGDGLAGVGDASVGALGATRSGLSKVGDATVGLTTNTINATVGVVNLSVNATMDGAGLLAGGVGTSSVACPHPHPAAKVPPLLSHQLVQNADKLLGREDRLDTRELELDLSGWNSWSRSARAGHEAGESCLCAASVQPFVLFAPSFSFLPSPRQACLRELQRQRW